MSILLSAFLVHAAASTPPETAQPAAAPATPHRICRDMMVSSSRLGTVRVCKSKTAWERWQRCHSATRYCDPPRKSTVTVVSLPGDKLVCKFLKTTGSRIEQQKVCATKRQWDVAEQEVQETIRDRQNRSTLTGGSEELSRSPGGGPR